MTTLQCSIAQFYFFIVAAAIFVLCSPRFVNASSFKLKQVSVAATRVIRPLNFA